MSQVIEKYLTETEERALIKKIRDTKSWQAERDLHLFQLMRSTGCRVGTVCRLTVADATAALSSGTLVLRPEACKRKKGYDVRVTGKVETALKGLLKIRRESGRGMDPDAPLLVGRTKSRGTGGMTPRAVQMCFERWRVRAGLNVAVTPHWMRHTLAIRIMRNSTSGNPLAIAANQLGHMNINTTRIYTRPTREEHAMALREAGA